MAATGWALVGLLMAVGMQESRPPAGGTKRPNVLFIAVDFRSSADLPSRIRYSRGGGAISEAIVTLPARTFPRHARYTM